MNLQTGLLFICLHLAAGAGAQSSVRAIFDKNVVETGDTFVLRVLVTGVTTKPGNVDFSPWNDLLPADNILSRSDWTRRDGRWLSQYTLIAFDGDSLHLPPLKVPLRPGDSLSSNPLDLTVNPTYATSDVNDAQTIRDIRREPEQWIDYWPEALGVVVLVVLIIWWLSRKKPKPAVVIQPQIQEQPVVPPHQVALQKLTLLEQKQLWKKGAVEQFYAELSLIVREYLENRFRIPALESTTREILPLLKNAGFPESQNSALRELLHKSDMTKYAKHPPPEQFHEKALDMARQLIFAVTKSSNT